MQPTAPSKSTTGNPLLDMLLASSNQSQNVQNIMSGPVGQMVTNRQNYLDSTNNDIGASLKSLLANGQNGAVVNAGPSAAELNSNFAGNNSITQGLLGQILNSATGMAQTSQGNAVQAIGNQQNYGIQQQGVDLQKANAGYTDVNGNPIGAPGGANGQSGQTASNPVVDGAVQNILNGSKDIGSIQSMPPALQNQVYAQLQQRGYDPSKQATDALNQVEKAYFGYNLSDKNPQAGNELSNINGVGAGENAVTNWLSDISGGKIQLGNTPRIKNYQNLANTLQGNIESAVAATGGKPTARLAVLLKGGAPTENTSLPDAQNYFKAVRQALNTSFFPNGINPHENQIRVKIGNTTGTINAAEYDPKTMQKL